ncbi:MAG: ATP-binding cassette domain-containing protein [Phycisphaerae bacterium]|jgi:phospholipid/cholesterol/gamma-HCH transport system ATP-binding protein
MSETKQDIVLSVRDLVVRFDSAMGERVTVLNGVSFDAVRGETLVIMGGSGCGKSTLLNALIGEIVPDEGSIAYHLPSIGTVDLVTAGEDERDGLRKRLGILFQSGALFSSLTVAENVALPLREHSHVEKSVIDIIVAMKLQQVRMLPHRDKYPAQLSGGQKKRAGLARATAMDPEILFYDEPSAGLDPVTSSAIDELMMDLSGKLQVTSIVVTHEMDSAFRIADRMIMLEKGRIMRIGPRRAFEALRDADPATLPNDDDRLLHQFLRGAAAGPLTDGQGMSLYEKLLVGGDRTATYRR